MAFHLRVKNTFWELEMSPEESQCTVRQCRQRAYTDLGEYSSGFESTDLVSSKSSDLGSPRSTAMGSSRGSVADDASDRWADIYDSDDDDLLPSQTTASSSSRASSPPSRPEGTWSSLPSYPSRPAGTWFLPVATESATVAQDASTTLILKNLPAGCTHDQLRSILDEVGLSGLYNFIYVPFDFKKGVLFRYGFVNFEQHEQAVKAMASLGGFSGWVVDGEKGCEVEWSDQQSLNALIERYRNSPVMHCSVPVAYKPLLFERGVHITFPAPTKAVHPPKFAAPVAEADKSEASDKRTTIIVKNLPKGSSHNEFSSILDEAGVDGVYDFIYVPFDFKKSAFLRYGFVNFEKNEQAVKAMAILNGSVLSGFENRCEVEWGDAQQSLRGNIERYRNSPLMHISVPDAYKPVLFVRGVRIAFPAPTKVVKPMKCRTAQ